MALYQRWVDELCRTRQYAQADAVPFIKAATKLKNLQIHRTTMSDADLQDMLSALPDLEVFELKVSVVGDA